MTMSDYITEHYEELKIGVDKPFKFHCTHNTEIAAEIGRTSF